MNLSFYKGKKVIVTGHTGFKGSWMCCVLVNVGAEVIGYSEVYFCKLFKQNFGKSFIVYLNEYRIEKAKKLLENPLINIKDICFESGYRDANYFTRVFKRQTGMTPSEYRNGVMQR